MSAQKRPNPWTQEQLKAYGRASANGYLPGVIDDQAPIEDVWTTQRHLQAAKMRSQVFIPGF